MRPTRRSQKVWFPWEVELGAATDRGVHRQENEDAFDFCLPCGGTKDWPPLAVFAVADGMGGHAAGAAAARVALLAAIEACADEHTADVQLLEAIFSAANRAVLEASSAPGHQGMGTTLVCALLDAKWWLIGNVGDSRAYLHRKGTLRLITQDHSLAAERMRAQGIAEPPPGRHPYQNVLTRAVGIEPTLQVDTFQEAARSRDVLLLCTDGVSTVLSREELTEAVEGFAAQAAAERIVRSAVERDGTDNATALVIRLNKAKRSPGQPRGAGSEPGGGQDPS